jgi:hypothetical protein
VAEICDRYELGESTRKIASDLGLGASTVRSVLERNNITRRSLKEAMGSLSPEDEAEVCNRYLIGESSVQLAAAYDKAVATILRILEVNGIQRRQSGGLTDSVQDVIDFKGHHATPRDCDLYVYELSRYNESHCKVGISFDTSNRVSKGQGEYGNEALLLIFPSRAEAYFLEQAVLDATRGTAGCPEDLLDWPGASEVRAMPATDMAPIALRLAEELEDLGAWEFAAHYVPMTSAQRMTCQQRAMTSGETSRPGVERRI